jgi:ubiquinone/menaquinone biosynthesis C-methylase UbiE
MKAMPGRFCIGCAGAGRGDDVLGLYSRYILPHLINLACGAGPIEKQRAKIVPKACGLVLEIGFGSGRNVAHYDPAKVAKLIATEPEAGIRGLGAKAAKAAAFPVEIRAEPAERLSAPDASVDCVVCTYTLCTVADPLGALKEAKRVLKPGGRLYFCEHGLSPDAKVAAQQRAIEPVWSKLAGGCRLTRDPLALLAHAGFKLTAQDAMYLPGTPRFGGYNSWGEATSG